MWKKRIVALSILIVGVAIGYFVFGSEARFSNDQTKIPTFFTNYPFKLGLDLSGGSRLVYRADVSKVQATEVGNAMDSLRDVIERRVNAFGVSEPVVQVQDGGFTNNGEERLVIELPGVTDLDTAITMIGQTPLLEFKTEDPNPAPQKAVIGPDGTVEVDTSTLEGSWVDTALTGRYLDKAILEFDQTTAQPIVSLVFTKEGGDLFEKITKENVGKRVAIFLDGAPISTPVVQEAISGGRAQISGVFTPKEAKQLVGRLNSGALPVPVELISTQTVGPTLGSKATEAGMFAGMLGFLAIGIFLVLWYRLPGLVAVLSLALYIAIVLALYKLIPVTLTAAGIAGFIISMGIAVDANVLVFERIKEEIRNGHSIPDAIRLGFDRAWVSIRDSNFSLLITGMILFWFGTSLIKGFALTLIIGVLVSMFSAIVISRTWLLALGIERSNAFTRFLFSSGFGLGKLNETTSTN